MLTLELRALLNRAQEQRQEAGSLWFAFWLVDGPRVCFFPMFFFGLGSFLFFWGGGSLVYVFFPENMLCWCFQVGILREFTHLIQVLGCFDVLSLVGWILCHSCFLW